MSSTTAAVLVTRSIIYLWMDVHKESTTLAVLPADAKTSTRVDRSRTIFAWLEAEVAAAGP